jgi:uncharacterized protein (TIGR00269 family)
MNIETKVLKTIKEYSLFSKKDKILVACSGGKDSTTLLYILNKLGYKPEAITVDVLIGGYTKQNLENLKGFCSSNKIKLHVVSFRDEFGYSLCYIRSLLESKGVNLKSCTICGVLRRYLINKHARILKATKLVTGHNMNDEAQAIMMNLFKNNLEILARSGPKTGNSKDKMFVQRVKPLYFVSEEEVIKYSKEHKFPVKYSACPCRAGVYRCAIDEVLSKYEDKNKNTHYNIIKWFLAVSPLLKKKFASSQKQEYCKRCGEPAKGKICAACQILEKIKN